jgi:diacylglycerol kinase family enzyme
MTSVARRHDILVAAGGDGTASSVAATAVREGKIFGLIPTGTLNHFARDAGIPLELSDAVEILAAGHTRALDAAEVNGFVFINNASIGAYPRLVSERARATRRGLPRPFAVSLGVVRTWLSLRGVTVRLCVDGLELTRRTPFIFVGNGKYEVEGLRFGKRPAISDGTLSLYVAPESGRLDTLALPARALLGTLKGHGKFEGHQASSISMDFPRRSVAVALDGEIRALRSPLRFSIKPRALSMIVPRAESPLDANARPSL